ncbi:MAG: lactate utilization protein [Candidatus Micrarchaeota archaeon]
MANWDKLAEKGIVEKTMEALKANGISAEYVETGSDAKKRVLDLIPEGAEVMTMTSTTDDAIGAAREINESGKYDDVRKVLWDKDADPKLKRRLGAAADYATGSVHAATQDGHLVIASASGSQLPACAYSGGKVIWVVGTQKIVKNLDDAMKRIYEYVLPLESERARKAYGVPGSAVNKLLIINKEINPERLHLIFVNEKLGF